VRVALACHNFPPEFRGGTERVVLALAGALGKAGDDVVVLAGSDEPWAGEDATVERGLGVEVLRLRRKPGEGYGLVVRNLRLRDLVGRLLRERGCEVLHVHHWSTLSVQMGRRARALGVGVVATLHDMWTSCGRFFRRPPPGITCPTAAGREPCAPCAALSLDVPLPSLRRGIRHRDREIRRELRAAHFITAPSRFCADAVRSHVPWAGRIEVIPHGLLEPVDKVPPRSPAPGAPLRVGTFGNLVREKGILPLVEAAVGLPVELCLAGPFIEAAFEREVLARAAALGVRLSRQGAYGAGGDHPAGALDLAVFPSLCQETYGLVVEEALARGVPVVVSRLGALGERIGRGGMVVDPEAGALAAALGALVREPEALVSLRRGIPARFTTIGDAAEKYRELYRRAAAGTLP
jgi:glycosyltransferase involved in cell wall biosynthesis